ncbi:MULTISPECIES: hypothetical protein [unclassified Brevundimonas]|uniref:hypothetical protein n=1 Tax=unclassified Brevundimonas TaxID=2622653 RepID=UPI000AB2D8AA|nr:MULTISPECIES: hypothetical protein [unclassified Brevundimonas]
MTRSLTSHDDWRDALLLDEEAWDVPRRLTDADLFTHGVDGWRRAGCSLDDPEDVR